MECPNCHETHGAPLGCEQCGSMFCNSCQPYWDYTHDICQDCQERNTIAAIKEDTWTSKLRRWFNVPADLPVALVLPHSLPWSIKQSPRNDWLAYSDESPCWVVHAGDQFVAVFACQADAEYAVAAANSHHDLATVAAIVYNRIRNDESLWNGSEADLALWMRVKRLITPSK